VPEDVDLGNVAGDWRLPWSGGCRCGEVRLRISEPPIIAIACHCTGCQRMSSSAYALTLMVPASGFAVTAGQPVLGGEQKAFSGHWFCPRCKTWMFTRSPEVIGPFVNLRPTMLDDHAWFAPFIEIFVGEKLPWAATGAKYGFDRFPDEADRARLIAEFAEQGARPE
jgi:hypothetical protein